MRAVFLISLLAVGLSSAQQVGLGGCLDVTVMSDFDATKYLGTWYENRKYSAVFEAGGKCIKAEYGTSSETGVVSVVNSQINVLTSTASSIEGSAKLDSDDGEAKLTVTLSIGGLFNVSSPYWVLGTDYETYASVWSCADFGNLVNGQFAWVLTRDRYPSEEVIINALIPFKLNNIDTSLFQITDQVDCTN